MATRSYLSLKVSLFRRCKLCVGIFGLLESSKLIEYVFQSEFDRLQFFLLLTTNFRPEI